MKELQLAPDLSCKPATSSSAASLQPAGPALRALDGANGSHDENEDEEDSDDAEEGLSSKNDTRPTPLIKLQNQIKIAR